MRSLATLYKCTCINRDALREILRRPVQYVYKTTWLAKMFNTFHITEN